MNAPPASHKRSLSTPTEPAAAGNIKGVGMGITRTLVVFSRTSYGKVQARTSMVLSRTSMGRVNR